MLIVSQTLLVAFAVRALSEAVPVHNFRRENSIRGRFQGIMAHVDRIRENSGSKNLFLGTSIWHYSLDPRTFDALLAKRGIASESYNVSVHGVMGNSLLALVRALGLSIGERKVRATFLEMNPIMFSREYYTRFVEDEETWAASIFFQDSKLWREFLFREPAKSFFLYLEDRLRPMMWKLFTPLTDYLPLTFREPQRWSRRKPLGILEFWTNPDLQEPLNWNPETRGFHNWNLPASEQTFSRLRQKVRSKWERIVRMLNHLHGLMPGRFHFHPALVDSFHRTIEAALGYSENVYLVITPNAPSFQARVEEYVDVEYLKREFGRHPGVKIIDLRRLPTRDEDYVDPQHPTRETMDRFLPFLAEAIDFPSNIQ